MAALIWPLLIYWLVMFVACYVVVEIGHDQLYDAVYHNNPTRRAEKPAAPSGGDDEPQEEEPTPPAAWRIALGSLLIAILLTTLRAKGLAASFESMFTSNIAWTVLQGLVWFGVFLLLFQFHPWHALGVGLATMLLVTGLATMGVESLLAKPVPTTQSTRPLNSNQPVRQSVAPAAPPASTAAPAQGK
jgi:hypothetical protein